LITYRLFAEKPTHGKLNEYATSSEFLTYTPHPGEFLSPRDQPIIFSLFISLSLSPLSIRYVLFFVFVSDIDYTGTDFFTFRLTIGSLSSAAATVAITIDDEEAGGGAGSGAKKHPPKSRAAGKTGSKNAHGDPSAPPSVTSAAEPVQTQRSGGNAVDIKDLPRESPSKAKTGVSVFPEKRTPLHAASHKPGTDPQPASPPPLSTTTSTKKGKRENFDPSTML
jgi:hypothetical protein